MYVSVFLNAIVYRLFAKRIQLHASAERIKYKAKCDIVHVGNIRVGIILEGNIRLEVVRVSNVVLGIFRAGNIQLDNVWVGNIRVNILQVGIALLDNVKTDVFGRFCLGGHYPKPSPGTSEDIEVKYG